MKYYWKRHNAWARCQWRCRCKWMFGWPFCLQQNIQYHCGVQQLDQRGHIDAQNAINIRARMKKRERNETLSVESIVCSAASHRCGQLIQNKHPNSNNKINWLITVLGSLVPPMLFWIKKYDSGNVGIQSYWEFIVNSFWIFGSFSFSDCIVSSGSMHQMALRK